MTNFFARRGAAAVNEMNQSLGALLGIATGMLAGQELKDTHILFLNDWLTNHSAISTTWPGDVVHERVKDVLADGRITEEERAHLVATLQDLVGGTLAQLADNNHVTQLLPYETPTIRYEETMFCLTGNFAYAPRAKCEAQIVSRGGIVKPSVSKKILYLVIGGLGSSEWKHGSFGTKVDRAMELKREGAQLHLVREDHWVSSLRA